MKKILLITALLLCSAAAQSSYYVKMGSTSDSTQAKQIQNSLQNSGFNVDTIRKQNSTVLYVGPYSKKQNAANALGTLQQTYPSAYVVRRNDSTANKRSNGLSDRSTGDKNQSPFFATGALGYHKSDPQCANTAGVTVNTPSTSGMNYGIGIGYKMDTYRFKLEYAQLGGSDASMTDITASVTHDFLRTRKFTYFAGMMLGTSSLDYDSPLTDDPNSTSSSSSTLIGLQAGARYKLDIENLWAYGRLDYAMLDHQTNFENGGNIRQSTLNNLTIGVGYNF